MVHRLSLRVVCSPVICIFAMYRLWIFSRFVMRHYIAAVREYVGQRIWIAHTLAISRIFYLDRKLFTILEDPMVEPEPRTVLTADPRPIR